MARAGAGRAIPTGIVHINDQTVNDEANAPFGGVGASGTGSRFGGAAANIEAFTETQWVTVRSQPADVPVLSAGRAPLRGVAAGVGTGRAVAAVRSCPWRTHPWGSSTPASVV